MKNQQIHHDKKDESTNKKDETRLKQKQRKTQQKSKVKTGR